MNELRGLIQDESGLVSFEIEDSLLLDKVEAQLDFEPEELPSSPKDGRAFSFSDDNFRLFRAYSKDLASESSLLTPGEDL
jgi:hypothetical protein